MFENLLQKYYKYFYNSWKNSSKAGKNEKMTNYLCI